MQLSHFNDYRPFLRRELERRVQSRPGYSLRAFARDLSVPPQVLSLVLNGKKGISVDVAAQMTEKLRLSEEETDYFLDLVLHAQARTEQSKKILARRLESRDADKGYRMLQEDVFRAISDWYHAALIELTRVDGFRSDSKWIARKLKISQVEAKEAMDRLLRLGLLREVDGKLYKTERNVMTSHDVPSEAIRHFHRQVIAKAGDALDEQAVMDREFSAMVLAIDPSRMQEAKEKLKKFRREFVRDMETAPTGRSRGPSEIYCLSSQFFRLTQTSNPSPKGEVK